MNLWFFGFAVTMFRLAYGIWILERIVQEMQSKQVSQTYIMYDIACTLFSHLQV